VQESQYSETASGGRRNPSNTLWTAVAELSPAYFAMVMATGIVSIASQLVGLPYLGPFLLWLNTLLYIILWILTVARMVFFPAHFFSDLSNHARGVGYFTVVAGTCILGSQYVILSEAFAVATSLLFLGVVLWAILIYVVFAALVVRPEKPSLAEGINGTWLVSIVSTQGVAILSDLLAPGFTSYREELFFFSLCMFLSGVMLYIIVIVLISYRLLFFPLTPEAFTSPYWINMGAVAISTLAGAVLFEHGSVSPLLHILKPFILGFTIFLWATATWWIPLLLVLGAWRYLVMRVKFTYTPEHWGMVFPLGMYTTCTAHLAMIPEMDFLSIIPHYFIYFALLAWSLTFAGLLKSLAEGMIYPTAGKCST
jgi:tellurite resistance protein TehA-like permease